MTKIELRVEDESNRIISVLKDAEVSETTIQALSPIVENVAWMKIKLDDARSKIKTGQITTTYDNGGGQKGTRENPLFKGYENLWKSYMLGMNKILDVLPDNKDEALKQDIKSSKSALDIIRARRTA